MTAAGKIRTITTPFVFGVTVNCYLVASADGFVLVDTGMRKNRGRIAGELKDAGCRPGDLKLIVLTHGDVDHCGNAAFLAKRFRAPIALHRDDVGMVERGGFFWSRRKRNAVLNWMMNRFFVLPPEDRFSPDRLLDDGSDLTALGLAATVIALPGHSRGSVGILTADGDLFCGDLLANTKRPELWSIIDDPAAAAASVEKLRQRTIRTVYPGHGAPFAWAAFAGQEGLP